MVVNDPIADTLTRIRNGIIRNKDSVIVLKSKVIREILRVLKEEGYIKDFEETEVDGKKWYFKVFLKPGFKFELKRVSKPGRRIYVGVDEIPRVLHGMGISILSTSKGIMSGREAKRKNVGGELMCIIY